MKKRHIALVGGHLTCALATISALRQKEPGIDLIFLGRKYPMEGDPSLSAEYQIIPKLGIKFLSMVTGRLQRRVTKYTICSLAKIPFGFFQSFWYLTREKPDVICSFGGYLSFPVVFAGWILGISSITHEQSVIPGLATKLNSLFVKKVAISWPQTKKYLKNKKIILTGNPIRKEIFRTQASDSKLKKFLNSTLSPKPYPLIYITGGNQGSHFINEAIGKILPKLLKKYFVIHQTGDSKIYNDYEELSSQFTLRRQSYGASATVHSSQWVKRYFLTKYIDSADIGAVLARADLVISRAGANMVTELLALGKPAILIPLPWAAGSEQEANAQLLQEVGIGKVLSQEKITPQSLFQSIDEVTQNLFSFKKNALEAKKLVKPEAAEKLAGEVLNLLKSAKRE
jgi:UDP-N-acetylglucosamine--N-acetylmuramyl-(pentapeptide) pyrophosphoryl-undecaprenol N-acetylglucosamine transferase